MLPDHTSASQLATYAMCPRKYAYRYVDLVEPEYKSISLCLGSAVGSAVSWWFDAKLEGKQPTGDDVLEILSADLAAATDDASVRWGQWTPQDLEAHAGRMLGAFLREYGDLAVVETERRFELDLIDPDTGEVMPRKLVGYFDLVLAGGSVVELKTARGQYSNVDLATNLQFGAYRTFLIESRHNSPLVVIAIIKNKTPRLQREVLPPTSTATRWFMSAAVAIETAILTRNFPPSPGTMCSSCEYLGKCIGMGEVDDVEQAA